MDILRSAQSLLLDNLALVAVASFVIFILRWYFDRDRIDYYKIPGPPVKWPIIGNIDLLYDKKKPLSETILPVHYELSKKYTAGFYRFLFGMERAVMFHKAAMVEALFSSSVNITKGEGYKFIAPWLGKGLLLSTGAKWKHHRKLLTVSCDTFSFDR